MPLEINLDDAQGIAVKLALEAGRYSQELFGKVEVEWKEEDTPQVSSAKWYISRCVTSMDSTCQKIITDGLKKAGFNRYTGILAEEKSEDIYDFADNPSLRWVIDPIDGTFNYATANAKTKAKIEKIIRQELKNDPRLYGISIGLQQNRNEFLFGVIFLPFLEELYITRMDAGATKNGIKLMIAQTSFGENSRIHINSKSDFLKPIIKHYEQPLCSVYSITSIADGRNDCFFARNTRIHDIGPASTVVLEAGGYCSDKSGQHTKYSQSSDQDKIPVHIVGPNRQFNADLIERIKRAKLEL